MNEAPSSLRILVVDDEFDVATALASVLEDEGHVVGTCNNGLEALARLPADPPDLVMLDVMMPGLNGLEVLARLRRAEPFARLPVILMSAVRPAGGVPQDEQLIFLRKPFDLDALFGAIDRLTQPAAGGA